MKIEKKIFILIILINFENQQRRLSKIIRDIVSSWRSLAERLESKHLEGVGVLHVAASSSVAAEMECPV
jgi:hypothetical protein